MEMETCESSSSVDPSFWLTLRSFAAAYLLAGEQGGVAAARALHEHLRRLSTRGSCLIFLNANGLAHALSCARVIQFPVLLYSFIQGFNSAGFPYSIIDVGAKDQAADSALRSTLNCFFPDRVY